jgi:hypothetical protein
MEGLMWQEWIEWIAVFCFFIVGVGIYELESYLEKKREERKDKGGVDE